MARKILPGAIVGIFLFTWALMPTTPLQADLKTTHPDPYPLGKVAPLDHHAYEQMARSRLLHVGELSRLGQPPRIDRLRSEEDFDSPLDSPGILPASEAQLAELFDPAPMSPFHWQSAVLRWTPSHWIWASGQTLQQRVMPLFRHVLQVAQRWQAVHDQWAQIESWSQQHWRTLEDWSRASWARIETLHAKSRLVGTTSHDAGLRPGVKSGLGEIDAYWEYYNDCDYWNVDFEVGPWEPRWTVASRSPAWSKLGWAGQHWHPFRDHLIRVSKPLFEFLAAAPPQVAIPIWLTDSMRELDFQRHHPVRVESPGWWPHTLFHSAGQH